ncbi:MAG: cobalamin-dependent protein [Syntrophaceticus sp.]|nr:cobalamin-dependent protein [Syntrophaceticus sp.]
MAKGIKVIACQVMEKEIISIVGRESNATFVQYEYHDKPELLHNRIQEAIECSTDYQCIILGFGLCGGAIDGIRAMTCPVIIPKIDIVATMLIGVGFDVYDLGVNVSKEEFINKAIEVQADIVGASAFMSSTYLYQLDIKKALDEAGLTPKVKYIIGGGAVYRQWAREIGADGFANDALEAVNLCKSFVSAKGV